MALDFPTSPSVGQTYSGPGGIVWQWDGTKWVNGAGLAAYAPIASPVFTGDPQAPTPAATDADTSVATTAYVTAAVGTALHNVGRYIHNPLFNVAQRGAGNFTAAGYTADRWSLSFAAPDTNSLALNPATDAQRAAVGDEAMTTFLSNSVAGSATAGAYSQLLQLIEGVRRLAGKAVTISFWAASSVASAKLGVSVDQIFGTGGSPSARVNGNGQTITLTTGWVRYSLTFSIPSTSGMTLGTAGNDCTALNFWFSASSTFATRAGSIGAQSGQFYLWGVQLEIGTQATPLEKPDPADDLRKCQRFYVGPCVVVGGASLTTGHTLYVPYSLPVTMRANPTTAISNNSSNAISSPVLTVGTSRDIYASGTASATGNCWLNLAFTASADL
jgi:hypothetical protein